MSNARAEGKPLYVASPLGFTMPTRIFYNRTLLPALQANGFAILDPWVADTEAVSPGSDIGARNERLLRAASAVFAILDGTDVDSGTSAEIGYATALGKPVVGWRSDLRQAGEGNGASINLQVEYFIRRHGGSVHHDLGQAIDALKALPSQGST